MSGTQTGGYDNASYLTRQQIKLGKTVAGSNGTSCYNGFPVSNMRLRTLAATVVVPGTATAAALTILAGTSSIGSIVLGTAATGTVRATTDLNYTLVQGTALSFQNAGDATFVAEVIGEMHIDPQSGFTAP